MERQAWTVKDSRLALAEGWDVFETDRGPEIQKNDATEAGEMQHFESDLEALGHVCERALQGSTLHRRALAQVGVVVKGKPKPRLSRGALAGAKLFASVDLTR